MAQAEFTSAEQVKGKGLPKIGRFLGIAKRRETEAMLEKYKEA